MRSSGWAPRPPLRPVGLPAQNHVHRDGAAEAARAFDPDPGHLVGVEQVDQLSETALGVGNLAAGNEPAGVVDDRHREGVFVGVYSGDHVCHLPFDVTAGPATRKHSGAANPGVAALPQASIGRPRRPSPSPGGSHLRASPSLAGSTRLSRPGDVADPRTSQEQAEHPRVHQVCRTSNLEIGRGYVNQIEIVGGDRSTHWYGLGLSEGPVWMRELMMNQQAMRQAARRVPLDAQAVLRKERADRERRLQGRAIAALTALAERDALVRDAERRAGQALRTMTDDEGLSVREAVAWCGSGVTVREVTRLRQLAHDAPGGSGR